MEMHIPFTTQPVTYVQSIVGSISAELTSCLHLHILQFMQVPFCLAFTGANCPVIPRPGATCPGLSNYE